MIENMGVLNGIRVMEVSAGHVGPVATEIFALMGAEVIKVESRMKTDHTRIILRPGKKTQDPDASHEFNDVNLNKKGICLNLSQPRGLEVAKRLVAVSDVLLENYSAGTIDRLGLSYDVVKEIKPDIIMISASGSGTKGPEAGMHALAPVFGALSGLADMTGYPDGEPAEIRISGDYVNSATVFFVLLAALWHRKRTGQGQFIDYSSREGLCCFIGDSFMDYTMNNRVQSRNGNRDDVMAPHNCYRCRGEDKWVSIAIATEEEWNSFCNAIGDPEWANEERFSNARSRWQNQEELDKLVREWTIRYSPYEVMEILQKAGVAAVPSFSAQDMYTDPHLTARGFTEIVEHPKLGAAMIIRNPWRLLADPPRITRHAPLLGEHNEYVFGDLLGMEKEEIASLEEAKVIW